MRVPILALTVFALFLLVALGGRAWLQRVRTGRWGITAPRGATGRERFTGSLVAGGVVVMLAGAVAAAAGVGGPALERLVESAAVRSAALLAMAAGIALTLTAQLQMGDSWRTGVGRGEATSLVTRGLFARVRNPIFLGLGLFGAGFVLLVPTAVCLAGVLLAAAGIELQVRWVEEPFLLAAHGEAYRTYAGRVGRFLPWLGRLG